MATYSKTKLEKMTRAEVEALAREEFGIEDPQHRAVTKAELIDAILASQDRPETAMEPDEGIDTPEAPSAAPERDTGQQRDDLIRVVGATAPNTVSLWEQDRRHPGGEVWLVGGQTARVYPTPGVYRALRDRKLERS